MDKFAALAEPNRRRMIELIATRNQISSSAISNEFTISAPAVSQHLKILREAGLIQVEKRAQQRLYSLNSEGIDEIWEWLNQMRSFWNDRLDVLEKILTDEANKKDEGDIK
ncbi:ArsR/SmtB family transcription factor [Sneathiella glossodoripedis]|uniref:ArsR/SmtB family transcription factor n=1 Tax=Sneathiella glossodoripedis TaxID=418853 RepID=UPI000472CAFE|nr:metalloregulator ArsR/SmtB family transcription factor [Sneathiella glossodoripedis]